MLESKNQLMQALAHLYPEGFHGLDPRLPTPSNYQGYVAALLPGFAPHSEDELLAALAAHEAARAARSEARALEALVVTRDQFAEMLIRRGVGAQVEQILADEPNDQRRAILRAWYDHAPSVRIAEPRMEWLRRKLRLPLATLVEWFQTAMTYRD